MRQLLLLCLGALLSQGTFAQKKLPLLSPHDEAFNAYYTDSTNRPVVKGRILNLPDSLSRDHLIGYSAVALPRSEQKQQRVSVD